MAWLTEEEPDNWVQVLNYEGDFLGWAKTNYCHHLRLPFHTVETPKFFKEHPTIIRHAILAHESGALKARDAGGLSEIQTILLYSILIRKREEEEIIRKRKFEEDLLINNPELYKIYKDQQEVETFEEYDGVVIQDRVPENIEEFLAALAAFEDVEPDEEEDIDSGWLDTILSTNELNEMGE